MKKIIVALIAVFWGSLALADGINIPYSLKSKIITGTRDLTVATGSVAYTGMGFQPTACEAQGAVTSTPILAATAQYFSLNGLSDSARASASAYLGGGTFARDATNFLVFLDATGNNFQLATIASYDVDGLTLTWTKTGAPTGTASFVIRCLR